MNKIVLISLVMSFITSPALVAEDVIRVDRCAGDATAVLREAIGQAAARGGRPVTIRLTNGDYHISRECSSLYPYHVSNTASVEENPDCTKHIGLWLKGLKNVTLDGNGASLVTHGEMTAFAIDSCSGVTLRNLTLTSADPSVPEIRVLATDSCSATVDVTRPTRFEITPRGKLCFVGEGWRLADPDAPDYTPELAQVFYPETNVTLRCESPLDGLLRAQSLGGNTVRLFYGQTPAVHPGEVYQLRHGIRNEVCALINCSSDVELKNIEFNFLGNFGLVGQLSENLTYDNIRCRPRLGSGRTDAGFADFVQMSGCSGRLTIRNSYFEGAHDDPINIHGTHLKAVGTDGDRRLTVRYMHGQTFGFQPFFEGDSAEIVDRHKLNCLSAAKVASVRRLSDYDYELLLEQPLPALPAGYTIDDLAVENITRTPEVEISNCYFARTPTRGILITTRRRSVIEDNVFYRIPMPAILVSDDARGWYESGPVRDLVIRRNTFIECGSPVVDVNPEIDRYSRPVHSGIVVEDNRFILREGTEAVRLRATAGATVRNNVFELPCGPAPEADSLIELSDTSDLNIGGNIVLIQ